jgi:prophage tail gpP-like protein
LWRHIKIRKSLDDICHTLELEIPKNERLNVGKHDRITVRYVSSVVRPPRGLVTTVLVDEITASVDITKHGVIVLGRSPARDIIDSAWTDEVGGITLKAAANKIGAKFGITCHTFPTDGTDRTKLVHFFSWENESPWAKMVHAADINDDERYILTSSQKGDLYIWPVEGAVRQEGRLLALTEGRNIKTAEWKENGAEQYHTYVVTGGGESVTITDDTCRSNRILTIDITDPFISQEGLKRKAETERNRRKENRTTVAVAGWGLTDQQIQDLGAVTSGKEIFWVPNILIPVRIPSLGLSRNLLISEVEYEATPEAFGCVVTVVNRDAYL